MLAQRFRIYVALGQICLHLPHFTRNPVQITKKLAQLTGTGRLPRQLFQRLPHRTLFTREARERRSLLAGHPIKLLCPAVDPLLLSRQPL